jgi:DNA polymerase-3 subunit epsilon
MRYLAIDFETANASRSSICAFGYALFEDGKLVAQGADLCRPVPDYYDPRNVRIHGITDQKTRHLAGFEAHIDRIDQLKPDFIAAHNASFDISCIRHWCDQAGRKYPVYPYLCTVVTSRILYPDMGHTLADVSRLHGIALNHHEAGSDALACGLILQKAFVSTAARSAHELCQRLGIQMGHLTEGDYTACVSSRPSSRRKAANRPRRISEIDCCVDTDVTIESPLFDACVCFTGELNFASRHEAAQLAARRGARPQDTVTSKTNYLVVGYNNFIELDRSLMTTKLKKAVDLRQKGSCIEIISEDEFLDLLKS